MAELRYNLATLDAIRLSVAQRAGLDEARRTPFGEPIETESRRCGILQSTGASCAQHAPETAPDGSPGRSAPSYGDQCADTDGLARYRRDYIDRTLARFAVWATFAKPAAPSPIANDLARHRATAPALPARALRPHPPRGGIHCGPF